MSVEEFIEEILQENKEEVDDIIKLKEILDQLPKEENDVYSVSMTSNL